jgi:AraC-like DNA-binding protein
MTGIPTFRFSSDAIHPHERVATMCEVVGHGLVKLDITPLWDEGFRADLEGRLLPGLGILHGAIQGLQFDRPKRLIDNDDVVLALCLEGRIQNNAIGRDATMEPGDAVLMGGGEGGLSNLASTRFVSLRMPLAAVPSTVRPGELICRRIPAATPVLQLLRRYVQMLDDEHALAAPDVQRLAVTHVYDLFAATVGATRDGAEIARGRGVRAARLHAIKQDIAGSLAREDLSVATIATRHRCTPRYIQMLFEGEGTTFTEYVVAQRLARAHRMLTDPRHTGAKIISVAFDAGFGNLSNFNRAFRRQYGETPSDVRARAQQGNTAENS